MFVLSHRPVGPLACPARFERATYALEGRCSIQLSYGQIETRIAGLKNHGRGERIRTFDPLLPKQMRYQAALRPDKLAILHGLRNFTVKLKLEGLI